MTTAVSTATTVNSKRAEPSGKSARPRPGSPPPPPPPLPPPRRRPFGCAPPASLVAATPLPAHAALPPSPRTSACPRHGRTATAPAGDPPVPTPPRRRPAAGPCRATPTASGSPAPGSESSPPGPPIAPNRRPSRPPPRPVPASPPNRTAASPAGRCAPAPVPRRSGDRRDISTGTGSSGAAAAPWRASRRPRCPAPREVTPEGPAERAPGDSRPPPRTRQCRRGRGGWSIVKPEEEVDEAGPLVGLGQTVETGIAPVKAPAEVEPQDQGLGDRHPEP